MVKTQWTGRIADEKVLDRIKEKTSTLTWHQCMYHHMRYRLTKRIVEVKGHVVGRGGGAPRIKQIIIHIDKDIVTSILKESSYEREVRRTTATTDRMVEDQSYLLFTEFN